MISLFRILVLWVAGLLAGMQFAKVSIFLPEISILYASNAEQVVWLLTLVSIVGASFGGIAGKVAEWVGLKRLLFFSLVTAGCLSLCQAYFPPFEVMALLRVLEGFTHLGIVIAAPVLMAEATPAKWRGTVMVLWSTFFGVSFAILAWIAVPNIEELGISGLFHFHSLLLVLFAGLVRIGFPNNDHPNKTRRRPKQKNQNSYGLSSILERSGLVSVGYFIL
ncbi:MFS transporter [Yoonia sp. GPGPB17]|uniref:MFS transporter n=1 Tax=Yoonia sp. GPGPB17 TaxID=3026147 RepID=UPI0030C0E3C9